ncbi:MAG: helix-turn-helix domain-containing protein [Methylobacter sp.]
MISYQMSDKAIAEDIGVRFRQLRLRKNITLEQLHERTLISINTLKALEKGNGKLSTMIAVLRELGDLDALDHFIEPVTISPLQYIKMQGKQRKRARPPKPVHQPMDHESW